MSALSDEQRDLIIARLGRIGVIWVFAAMTAVLLLPYVANHFGIELGEADRALVNTTVSAINNAFFVVLGYLYGKSSGTQAKDEALVASSKANAATVLSGSPNPPADAKPTKTATVAEGETLEVTGAETK